MHSVLGYTNNALSPEQKAGTLALMLEARAAAGRLDTDQEVPLARVAAALVAVRPGSAPAACHDPALILPAVRHDRGKRNR
jgi:hypothetical protein